jgi:2-hydroxycyclohexanecarboxyl-CoA dehydrogenase
MEGKVAVVTGGANGIGKSVGERLRKSGWKVESLDLARDPNSPLGLGATDVTDEKAVGLAIEAVYGGLGSLDLLVNAAGISEHSPLESLNIASWRKVMSVNLDGALICMIAASKVMLRQGHGSVVNISSISAKRGAAGRVAYCASKAALEAVTRVAAVEWAKRGITVNAVAPGYVDSPMLHDAVSEGRIDLDEILAHVPIGRLISPDAVAAAVAYLASSEASSITGQVLTIDGGFLIDYGIGSSSAPKIDGRDR